MNEEKVFITLICTHTHGYNGIEYVEVAPYSLSLITLAIIHNGPRRRV